MEAAGQGQRSGLPERMVFFSDAVIAIAITLVAIDLPVPNGASEQAFYRSVGNDAGQYAAFVLSFGVVALAWRNHNKMHRVLTRISSRCEGLNLAWLLTVVLLPFASKLLTIRPHPPLIVHAYCIGFYALLEAASNGLILLMLRDARQRSYLVADGGDQVAALQRACVAYVAGFGLSIPFFFLTRYAWVLWVAAPLALHQWHRARQRRRKAVAAR